jgi:hypothetical protein
MQKGNKCPLVLKDNSPGARTKHPRLCQSTMTTPMMRLLTRTTILIHQTIPTQMQTLPYRQHLSVRWKRVTHVGHSLPHFPMIRIIRSYYCYFVLPR